MCRRGRLIVRPSTEIQGGSFLLCVLLLIIALAFSLGLCQSKLELNAVFISAGMTGSSSILIIARGGRAACSSRIGHRLVGCSIDIRHFRIVVGRVDFFLGLLGTRSGRAACARFAFDDALGLFTML